MRIRGVLFDLDNTLVDRGRSMERFADELMEGYAEALDAVEAEAVAAALREADGGGYRSKEAVFARLLEALPWRDRPDAQDLADFWYTTFPRCAVPMAGLYETLEALRARGLRVGIVTNGTEASQNAKVDRLDLRAYAESVVVSECAGVAKPDRRIFELALSELELEAAEACFVGDHPDNDVAGAAAAGLTPVWFSGHHPWPADRKPPAWRIERLEDLMPLLERIR